MLNVLIMAEIFGAKQSVGIILPLLIVADLTVYPMFRRYASWSMVWPLMSSVMVGLAIGYFLLGAIENAAARRVIGGIILLMVVLQCARLYMSEFLTHLPNSRAFRWGSGLVMGISTMMANAAGPAYSVYALVRQLPKNDFLGIGARCFLLVNLIKVPLMADLDIIHERSLMIDFALLPGVFGGILIGRRLIAKVPQKLFEILLYIFSAVAGVRLLFF